MTRSSSESSDGSSGGEGFRIRTPQKRTWSRSKAKTKKTRKVLRDIARREHFISASEESDQSRSSDDEVISLEDDENISSRNSSDGDSNRRRKRYRSPRKAASAQPQNRSPERESQSVLRMTPACICSGIVSFPFASMASMCVYTAGCFVVYSELDSIYDLSAFSPPLKSANEGLTAVVFMYVGGVIVAFPFIANFILWIKDTFEVSCFGSRNQCQMTCITTIATFVLIMIFAIQFAAMLILLLFFCIFMLSYAASSVCINARNAEIVIKAFNGMKATVNFIIPSSLMSSTVDIFTGIENEADAIAFCDGVFKSKDVLSQMCFGTLVAYIGTMFSLMVATALYQSLNGVGYNSSASPTSRTGVGGGRAHWLPRSFALPQHDRRKARVHVLVEDMV